MRPMASFLATGGFKFQLFQNTCMVYMLLLLHSAFMLSVVKMLLKREVGSLELKKVMEITLLIMELCF